MKTKKKRLKAIEAKINKLKLEFPDIDFKNNAIRRAYDRYYELTKEAIYLSVDISFCESEDAFKMCSDCRCWKYKQKEQ